MFAHPGWDEQQVTDKLGSAAGLAVPLLLSLGEMAVLSLPFGLWDLST